MSRVSVRVHPRSKQARVEWRDTASLEVWVQAPPAEGRANREVCRLVAEAVGVPPSSVRIVAGGQSRTKMVEIDRAAGVDGRWPGVKD